MQEISSGIEWFVIFLVIGVFFLSLVFVTRTFKFYGGGSINKIAIGTIVTIFLSAAIGIFFMVTVMLPGYTFGLTSYEWVDLFLVLFVFGFLSAMVAGLYAIHVQRGGF
jgi:hypothetical protein